MAYYSQSSKQQLDKKETNHWKRMKGDFKMEKLILKYGHRIPELIARALAGDAIAIAILAVMGISAAATCLEER